MSTESQDKPSINPKPLGEVIKEFLSQTPEERATVFASDEKRRVAANRFNLQQLLDVLVEDFHTNPAGRGAVRPEIWAAEAKLNGINQAPSPREKQ